MKSVEDKIRDVLIRDFPVFNPHRRDIEKIHASDIYLFCPRRVSLFHKNNISKPTRDLSIGEKVTFGFGTMIENLILMSLKNVLVGEFPKCCSNSPVFRYTAPIFKMKIAEDFILIGRPDAVIKIDGKRIIVDIKSIDGDKFNVLTPENVPLSYKYQMQTYLYLAEKSGLKYHDVAYLIFVTKKHNQMPIKIMGVKLEPYVKRQINKHIKALKDYIKTGTIPDRICMRVNDLMAKDCSLVNLCFKEGSNDRKNKQTKRKETSKKGLRKTKRN